MDEKIDIAFVPVDPRLGEQYCWGLDCFMKRTETKVVFPMHFWETTVFFNSAGTGKMCEKIMKTVLSGLKSRGRYFCWMRWMKMTGSE